MKNFSSKNNLALVYAYLAGSLLYSKVLLYKEWAGKIGVFFYELKRKIKVSSSFQTQGRFYSFLLSLFLSWYLKLFRITLLNLLYSNKIFNFQLLSFSFLLNSSGIAFVVVSQIQFCNLFLISYTPLFSFLVFL